MNIQINAPVYTLSGQADRAFIEIFNILLTATGPAHLDELLTRANKNLSLSAWFHWNFDNRSSCFWLKQRLAYHSQDFFADMLLTVPYAAFREKESAIQPEKSA